MYVNTLSTQSDLRLDHMSNQDKIDHSRGALLSQSLGYTHTQPFYGSVEFVSWLVLRKHKYSDN